MKLASKWGEPKHRDRSDVVAPRDPVLLLNCRECDDIQRLMEEQPRTCFCGKSAGRFNGKEFVTSGPSSMIEIPIEEYDGAAPGERKKWSIRK